MVDPFGPPQQQRASRPLQLVQFQPWPDGMNVELAQHELPTSFARYIQDGLLHEPGLIYRRGPVRQGVGVTSLTVGDLEVGMAATINPAGTPRVLNMTIPGGGGNPQLQLFDKTLVQVGSFLEPWPVTSAGTTPFIFDAKAALEGGVWIGSAVSYGLGAKQNLGLWKGAGKVSASGSTNMTIGAGPTKTVTGTGTSWTTQLEAGMFLLRNNGSDFTLIGVIKSVDSNTQITLEQYALIDGVTNISWKAVPVRGFQPRAGRGRITVAAGSTTVNGGNTRFLDQNISGSYRLYRASDMRRIGDVLSVGSNTQLTLAAGATVSMTNEKYVAFYNSTYSYASPLVGIFNAIWRGHQFFLNQDAVRDGAPLVQRLTWTDLDDPEVVDLTPEGTWLDVLPTKQSVNTMGLFPTNSALMIFREQETQALVGATPDDWTVRPVMDDGILAPMTAVGYGDGVVWAGRRGIYVYDGGEVINLLKDRAQRWYTTALLGFDVEANRAAAFINQDHYFVYIDSFASNIPIVKGGASTTPTKITLCINLKTGAISTMSNLGIRASVSLPGTKGVAYAVQTGGSAVNWTPVFCFADDLFKDLGGVSAIDGLTSSGLTGGPDFYVETPLYDLGNPQLKKRWKQIQMLHWLTTSGLNVDVFIGLDKLSSTLSTSPFVANSGFKNLRAKFQKRSTHMGFRLYQAANTMQRAILGPFGIGEKAQRPGSI